MGSWRTLRGLYAHEPSEDARYFFDDGVSRFSNSSRLRMPSSYLGMRLGVGAFVFNPSRRMLRPTPAVFATRIVLLAKCPRGRLGADRQTYEMASGSKACCWADHRN